MTSMADTYSGLVEVRQYTLVPSGIKDYLKISEGRNAQLRAELLPFLGMFMADTGGVLNRVHHLYHYDDYHQRDEARKAAAANSDWTSYVSSSRKFVQMQESQIFVPAAQVMEAALAAPVQHFQAPTTSGSSQPVYELRQFQLQPGDATLKTFLAALQEGVGDLSESAEGQLVFAGHSEMGVSNCVVELWWYPSTEGCVRSRQIARALPSWRQWERAVVACVQHSQSTILQPVAFSPMK